MMCAVLALSVILLAGCGDNKTPQGDSSSAAASSSSIATSIVEPVDVLEGCELTDEQMKQVVEDYFAVLQAVMTQSGDPVEFKTDVSKDGYDVYTVRDGETSDEPSLSWENVREAYRFLYSHGQVDLEGNLLVTEDMLLEAGEG